MFCVHVITAIFARWVIITSTSSQQHHLKELGLFQSQIGYLVCMNIKEDIYLTHDMLHVNINKL